MDKKKLFITVIIGSMIFLLAMGVMFSGSKNVSAVDYEKVYNDDLKEVVIKDKGIEVATIKLLTPLDNHVGLGYQRVAEYKVNSIIALESLTSTIETYNINDKMKEISRNIDYKIKTIEEIIVNDYETICENNNIGDKKINISENETCEQILVGNHTEERVVWNDLNKIKFNKDMSRWSKNDLTSSICILCHKKFWGNKLEDYTAEEKREIRELKTSQTSRNTEGKK